MIPDIHDTRGMHGILYRTDQLIRGVLKTGAVFSFFIFSMLPIPSFLSICLLSFVGVHLVLSCLLNTYTR